MTAIEHDPEAMRRGAQNIRSGADSYGALAAELASITDPWTSNPSPGRREFGAQIAGPCGQIVAALHGLEAWCHATADNVDTGADNYDRAAAAAAEAVNRASAAIDDLDDPDGETSHVRGIST